MSQVMLPLIVTAVTKVKVMALLTLPADTHYSILIAAITRDSWMFDSCSDGQTNSLYVRISCMYMYVCSFFVRLILYPQKLFKKPKLIREVMGWSLTHAT